MTERDESDEPAENSVDEANGDTALELDQRLFKLHLVAFGARVRDIRRLRRITQLELEARSGIRRTALSAIERGQTNITLETLFRLARALDVHWAELLDDREVAQLARYREPPGSP